ncbi:hypothetical protein L6452_18744 [Arctium lappa]|uniref:Uncharacterized protein n=1 Tax=Arctium lappa TaxID=4217 RepID=A0ACB9C7C4_ARCLA|nr:hypothetical protein L6452_18744 [Arctium lappa]
MPTRPSPRVPGSRTYRILHYLGSLNTGFCTLPTLVPGLIPVPSNPGSCALYQVRSPTRLTWCRDSPIMGFRFPGSIQDDWERSKAPIRYVLSQACESPTPSRTSHMQGNLHVGWSGALGRKGLEMDLDDGKSGRAILL